MIFWHLGRRVRWQGVGGVFPATTQPQLTAAALDEEHPLLADLWRQHGDLFDEPQVHHIHDV